MPFNVIIRALLEDYTRQMPYNESEWYGPWNDILKEFFPADKGYIVTPQKKLIGDDDHSNRIPDFVIEVIKVTPPSLKKQIVLIVEIKNSQYWRSGISALEKQMKAQAENAFSRTAEETLYYIMVIGPHWMYGKACWDGEDDLIPLGDWHDVTHDEKSYIDLRKVAELVYML
jgi:hypothetical protein